jgi:hypothetical protein
VSQTPHQDTNHGRSTKDCPVPSLWDKISGQSSLGGYGGSDITGDVCRRSADVHKDCASQVVRSRRRSDHVVPGKSRTLRYNGSPRGKIDGN